MTNREKNQIIKSALSLLKGMVGNAVASSTEKEDIEHWTKKEKQVDLLLKEYEHIN